MITDKTHKISSRKSLGKIALAGLLAATFPGFEMPARANNIVINGSFGNGTADNQTNLGTAGAVLGSSSGTITGWTECSGTTICPSGASTPNNGNNALAFLYFPGTQADSLTDTYGTNNFSLYQGLSPNTIPNTSPDGGNFLVVDGGSGNNLAIYQSISGLTAGATYQLTFYQAAGQQAGFNSSTTEQWEVFFGATSAGNQPQDSPEQSNPKGDFQPWTQVTLDFTAQSTTQILEFLALGTPSGDPPMDFLDGIAMSKVTGQNPTPEPSTFAIGCIGMLALLFVRRLDMRRQPRLPVR